MLQQAKNKAAEQNLNNTEFKQMDLEHLEFEDGTFDVATSSFGLFFLEDMTHALNNISRVVRPEGRIAITSFTGEAFSPMADIFIKRYESTGREVPPLSWKRLATEELIKEQFNAVGIKKVDIHHEPLGYQMTDPQMWWDVIWNAGWRSLLTNFTGSKIERVSAAHRANYMDVICNQMPEEEQKQFEKEHIKEISDVFGNDGVWAYSSFLPIS